MSKKKIFFLATPPPLDNLVFPRFLFTLHISFFLGQIPESLTKFIKNNINICNKKYIWCENIFNDNPIVLIIVDVNIFLHKLSQKITKFDSGEN